MPTSRDDRRMLRPALLPTAIMALLAAAVAAPPPVAAGGAAGAAEIPGSKVVDLGPASLSAPVTSAELVGDTMYMVSRELSPARLVSFDMPSRTVTANREIPTGIEGWAITAVNGGKDIYFGMHTPADLYHFDTTTGDLERVARFSRDILVMAADASPDGKIYLGTMGREDGSVYEYDPATGKVRDYGQVATGERYVRSIAVTEDTIYAGLGTQAKLVAIDRDTGAKTDISPPELADESFVYELAVSGDTVAFGTEPSGMLGVLDRNNHDDYRIVRPENARTVNAIAIDGDQIYFTASFSGTLYRYDRTEGSLTDLATPLYGEEHRGLFVKDEVVIAVGASGVVWTYDRATGETELTVLKEAGMPAGPEPPQSLTVVDGTPYVGGHMGFQAHDVAAGASRRFQIGGEPKAMMGIDGTLYAAIYPASQVWSYQPDAKAPQQFADIEHQQMRPRDIAYDESTDSLLVGTRPVYGQLGGALSVIEHGSATIETYRNIIEDQSVRSLATLDGNVYLGSEIYGEVAPPVATEAVLAGWDIRAEEKLWQVVPVPGAPEITSLVTMSYPSGDVVYGTAGKWVFVVNAESGELLYRQSFQRVRELKRDGDQVYGVSDPGIFRIDRVSERAYDFPIVATGDFGHLAVDDTVDSVLYATSGRNLMKVTPSRCPQPDRRDTVIVGSIDSGVPNVEADRGCTINDLIDEDGNWSSHGQFVRHVTEVASRIENAGVIGQRDFTAIVRAAARSDVGKK